MNKFCGSIIILLTAFLIASCDSKETPVNELDDLTEEISENSKEYSDEDWEEATLQYQQIEADLEKHHSEYTDAELKENMEDMMHEASGLIEGFTEGLSE